MGYNTRQFCPSHLRVIWGTWLQPIILHNLLQKLSLPEDERKENLTAILMQLGGMMRNDVNVWIGEFGGKNLWESHGKSSGLPSGKLT